MSHKSIRNLSILHASNGQLARSQRVSTKISTCDRAVMGSGYAAP